MAITEIMGSRETTAEGKIATAVKLLISTDGVGGAVAGANYLLETTPTGRKLVRAKITPEVIPGLVLHTEQYQGFVAYA